MGLKHVSLSLYNHFDTHEAQHHDMIFNYHIDIMPSNSCNTGTSTLIDMYACPQDKCGHIRQNMSACVTTNMLHFW